MSTPAISDEEVESRWWDDQEPDTRVHDKYCPRSECDPRISDDEYGVVCLCWLIQKVMERETQKLTNLRGYRILTVELYEELVSRPEIPF